MRWPIAFLLQVHKASEVGSEPPKGVESLLPTVTPF